MAVWACPSWSYEKCGVTAPNLKGISNWIICIHNMYNGVTAPNLKGISN